MAIITVRKSRTWLYWKGFQHGKASRHDQLAARLSETVAENGTRSLAAVLEPQKPPRFHPTTDICYLGTPSVFRRRLSRHNRYSAGPSEYKGCSWPYESATLHNSAESPAEDVKKNIFEGLLAAIFDYARKCGLIKTGGSHVCCIDSTGMENHYVSRHFLRRKGIRTAKYRKWTKLTAVCDNKSHLIASAIVSTGPSTDCHYLRPAVAAAIKNISINTLLADSGYDAEYNHQICHEQFGIRSTVIQVNDRNLKYGRTGGRYRRRMKRNFPKAIFRKRWHIESVFSRFKRKLGNSLTARKNESRACECLLRVLTYNLLIVLFTLKRTLIY